jgi:RNA polymerase sigma factor (sigma-70 family)
MLNDAELLDRYVQDRSESAFTELVQRHIGVVYSAAFREACGDVPMAEDITQAVFAELARDASRLRRHPALAGWLYTSVRQMVGNARRAGRRRQQRELAAHTMNETFSSDSPDPLWQQIRPVLDDVMHELNDLDRSAVVLRFFEGRSLRDIGLAIGLNEDAARKRVDRALEKLRALLAKRGVTSTASGLAAALAAGAVISAPSGLAASVAAGALALTTTATSTTFTLLTLMSFSKWKMAAAILLLAAAVAVPIVSGVLHRRALASRSETERALPAATTVARIIKADDILPHITPGPGGIPIALLGQQELAWGKQDGVHDPSAAPGQPGCFGLAWLVKGYSNAVVVFQDKRELQFEPGGWYSLIRLPDNIQITAEDLGKIQAEWLKKTYGGAWTVAVLR